MLGPAEDQVLERFHPGLQSEADHTWNSAGQLLLHLLHAQVSTPVIISGQTEGTLATFKDKKNTVQSIDRPMQA